MASFVSYYVFRNGLQRYRCYVTTTDHLVKMSSLIISSWTSQYYQFMDLPSHGPPKPVPKLAILTAFTKVYLVWEKSNNNKRLLFDNEYTPRDVLQMQGCDSEPCVTFHSLPTNTALGSTIGRVTDNSGVKKILF